MGHKEVDCWTRQKDGKKQANITEEIKKGSKLFMSNFFTDDSPSGVRFMYNGCSNHMSRIKSLFKELDESQNSEIRLGEQANEG